MRMDVYLELKVIAEKSEKHDGSLFSRSRKDQQRAEERHPVGNNDLN